MNHINSRATILHLQKIFSRFGVPEILVSDNGSAFTSAEFAEFCLQNGIQHMRTPPHHPQSNGQVERFVDTFKRALFKLNGEGTTQEMIETFLMAYRATPHPNTPNNTSPAETLMHRKIRLPVDVILPTKHLSLGRNTDMEQQFNRRHGAVKHTFVPGQSVLAKDYRGGGEKWTPGLIRRRTGQVVYDVDVQSSTWVRHANQLRPCYQPATITSNHTVPLDIILDTFELPQCSTPDTPVMETPLQNICAPRRWTTRPRKQLVPMQVNPCQRSYDQ